MRYKGILARKMRCHTAMLAASVTQSHDLQSRRDLEAEVTVRVKALFDAHEVNYENWRELAIKLAVAHVPGFQVEKPRGPAIRWDPWDRAKLRVTIDELRKLSRTNMSISSACAVCAKQSQWKSKVMGRSGGVGQLADALRRQYYLADEQFVAAVRDAQKLARAISASMAKADARAKL